MLHYGPGTAMLVHYGCPIDLNEAREPLGPLRSAPPHVMDLVPLLLYMLWPWLIRGLCRLHISGLHDFINSCMYLCVRGILWKDVDSFLVVFWIIISRCIVLVHTITQKHFLMLVWLCASRTWGVSTCWCMPGFAYWFSSVFANIIW